MSNIAEGFERGGSVEFSRFLSIAKGSAGEVESPLVFALDLGYLSRDEFDRLHELVRSTEGLVTGFIKYLRRSSRPRNRKK